MRAPWRWMRRLLAGLALLALTPTGALRAQPVPYEINVIGSLTGPAAFLGSGTQATLKALERTVNDQGGVRGQPIRFVFQDDQTSPQVALQLATALSQKNLPVILGPSVAATCRAVAPLFSTNGPVLYCLSPLLSPPKDSYLYTVIMSGRDVAGGILRFYREQGFHRIGVIATTDASGQNGEVDIRDALSAPENRGMEIVVDEHFNPTDLSIAAQLARVKSANPDAVIVFAPGTPFATVLRGMHDAGIDLPTATTEANLSLLQVKQYDAFVPKNLYFQGHPPMGGIAENAAVRRMQRLFFDAMKRDNVPADNVGAFSWDAGMLVVEALRRFGPAMTAKQLHDYLDAQRAWPGIIGLYDFQSVPHRGLSQKDALIMRWDKDRQEFVAASQLGGAPLPTRR